MTSKNADEGDPLDGMIAYIPMGLDATAMGIEKWPATKQDVIAAAKKDGVPQDRIDAFAKLPKDSYKDVLELRRAVANI